jgi:hypothetical protein
MTGWVVKSPVLCLGQASSLRCWSFVALSNPQRFEPLTTSSTMSALHAWRHRCVAAKWCTRVGRLVDIWGCVKIYEIHWNRRVPFGFDLIIPLWVLWLGWNSWWVVKYDVICRLARRHQLPEMLRKVSRSETNVFRVAVWQTSKSQDAAQTHVFSMVFQMDFHLTTHMFDSFRTSTIISGVFLGDPPIFRDGFVFIWYPKIRWIQTSTVPHNKKKEYATERVLWCASQLVENHPIWTQFYIYIWNICIFQFIG